MQGEEKTKEVGDDDDLSMEKQSFEATKYNHNNEIVNFNQITLNK